MAERRDPYGAYNFEVELDGINAANFGDCSGLENSQSVINLRGGEDPDLSPKKMPGLVSYSDVTLTRGVGKSRDLWDWRERAVRGDVDRRDISIKLRDDKGDAKVTWNLYGCWPRKWVGPRFDASADEVAIEQIVLVVERVEVSQWTH